MADKKISELTALTTPDGAEELVVNDGGTSKKITIDNIFNQSIDVTGTVTVDGDMTFGDNNKAKFGASDDLQIYHSGSHSLIEDTGSGDLKLRGTNLKIQDSDGNDYIECTDSGLGGTVTLKHTGTPKLATATTGIDVTGKVETSGGSASSPAYSFMSDPDTGMFNATGNAIGFTTAGAERMRIDSSGKVLIGETSLGGATDANLHVWGNSSNYCQAFKAPSLYAGGYRLALFAVTSSHTTVGMITSNGSSTSYNTTSDYRLKEDWQPMSGSIDRLNQLNPVNFAWKSDGSRVDGFLAHEAQAVVPESVTGTKDAMTTEEYEVSPATGEIFIPAIEEITEERQVTETVETGSYVNLAGETITETTEQPVTTEVTTTVIERQDIDGVMTEVEVEQVTQEPVMETVVTTEAVAEQIIQSNVEKPEELTEGQQWRETTAAVMGTREVEDYQGVDQSKFTPLITAALQEAIAEIESLKARLAAAGIA